jgi:hypothetical protein
MALAGVLKNWSDGKALGRDSESRTAHLASQDCAVGSNENAKLRKKVHIWRIGPRRVQPCDSEFDRECAHAIGGVAGKMINQGINE